MTLSTGLVVTGMVVLAALGWYRSSPKRGAWATGGRSEAAIGFALPLWAIALILCGIGLGRSAAEPAGAGPSVAHTITLVIFGLGVVALVAGVLALFGVAMPPALLPAWLRERRTQPPGEPTAEAPEDD